MSTGDRIRRTANESGGGVPAFRRPSGRASYPHRTTLDMDAERYEFLRHAVWEQRTTVSELLRAVIDLFREDPSYLARAVERATAGEQPAAEVKE